MTYIPNPKVSFKDGPNIDSFGRLRVSTPYTIFDSKQLYSNDGIFWSDIQVSGGGTTSTFNTNQSSTTLAVSNLTAGRRVRQTKRYFNYQPGKSQLGLFTGIIGTPATGITRRIGLFNDNNGLFFESGSTGVCVAVRSYVTGSVVTTKIFQDSWNLDKLDGTGESQITLDFSKVQIFVIDYEWLGVGRVRFGFVIGGNLIYVHEQKHANTISTVYMSTPNLPVRYEIENDGTGGVASVLHICCSVMSEGGVENAGFDFAIDRGTNFLDALNDNRIYPLVSVRLKDGRNCCTIVVKNVSVMCITTGIYKWSLIYNPTITGGTMTWADVPNTSVSANITTSGGLAIVDGTGLKLASGYTSQNNLGDSFALNDIDNVLAMGFTVTGGADVLVLAVQKVSGGAEDYVGGMSLRELT